MSVGVSASCLTVSPCLRTRTARALQIEWLKWGIFKRQITMNVYERLAISFR